MVWIVLSRMPELPRLRALLRSSSTARLISSGSGSPIAQLWLIIRLRWRSRVSSGEISTLLNLPKPVVRP